MFLSEYINDLVDDKIVFIIFITFLSVIAWRYELSNEDINVDE